MAEAIKSNSKSSEFDAGNADSQNGESAMYENVYWKMESNMTQNSEFSGNADENGVSALYENSILAEGINSNKKKKKKTVNLTLIMQILKMVYQPCMTIVYWQMESNQIKQNSEFNSGKMMYP